MASTDKMVGNQDDQLTNEEVFRRDFYPKMGLDLQVAEPIFTDFYANDFNQLQGLTGVSPEAREAVQAAIQRSYNVVVATNPVFPRIAIEARLRWANLHDLPWQLITCYEEMHFCKPNPRYFGEILSRIGARPEECLMVGNDVEEDMVSAGSLGIKTYLSTECLINRSGSEPNVDWAGTLGDLRDRLLAGSLE
jgi:HAD superfamily hydrolase (TIGR01549 family)